MGAWRLRAIVYGMLAAVSALVLWQSGALAGEPEPPRTLHGQTSQGHPVTMIARPGALVSFSAGALESRCDNGAGWRVRWYPTMGQANVSYTRAGDRFRVHEWPDSRFGETGRDRAQLYMTGSFLSGGRIAGTIWFSGYPGGIRCQSGAIGFSANP